MPTRAKSAELHWLLGTESEAKHVPSEADRLQPSRPKYPRGISAAARKVFKELVQQLEERRHVTAGDEEIIRLVAVLRDRHTRALEKLAAQGEVTTYTRLSSNGNPVQVEKPNLWLKVAEVCESKILAGLVQLGLTPASRKNVQKTSGSESSAGTLADLERQYEALLVSQPPQEESARNPADFDISDIDLEVQ